MIRRTKSPISLFILQLILELLIEKSALRLTKHKVVEEHGEGGHDKPQAFHREPEVTRAAKGTHSIRMLIFSDLRRYEREDSARKLDLIEQGLLHGQEGSMWLLTLSVRQPGPKALQQIP